MLTETSFGLTLAAIIGPASAVIAATAGSLTRTDEPVVIMGAQLGTLHGLSPDRIVAFRFQPGWQQVPLQCDERQFVDFGIVYREHEPLGLGVTAYADPNTDVGPDFDPTFDEDDELVFMADDAGSRAPIDASFPAGTLSDLAVEIELTDPMDHRIAYMYLFHTDGTLTPDAGRDYVTYTFNLLEGDYLTHYNTENGPNPEDSEAFSPYYRTHFSDRWIRDELNIYADSANGVDILDRHKAMFGPGLCGRTEDTFSAGEGAFFINKDGPVRALRSYLGANSGPFTQRDHLFYQRRQEIITYLRVHPILGIMDLYDYSPNAFGMVYFNDRNLDGVTVDGWPDQILAGPLLWEMMTGEQGSIIIAHVIETDIANLTHTSFYSDDEIPQHAQCTGDDFEFATSGVWVDQTIPNTDPQFPTPGTVTGRRIAFYEPTDQDVEDAALRYEQVKTPLDVVTRTYPRRMGDFDGNGRIDLEDCAALADCLSTPRQCAGADCQVFDWDADCDVDLRDYATFMTAFGAPMGGFAGCG